MERKLTAILAADVVGYSRLMEADEAGTFARLRAHRKELFEPEIEKYHGRIFKLMGDGLLAEFGSVVDAVECAVALQRCMAERNGGLADGQRIDVRLGINLGDVIVEGEDRHGEGVNVAARLQQLCDPGGVLISGTAYDHLRGKLDLPLDYAGEQRVKNISRPVRTYCVRLAGSGKPWRLRIRQQMGPTKWVAAILVLILLAGAGYWWMQPATPVSASTSIAILPFDDLGGDEATERLADGITEDIITDLARFRAIEVIARNSIMIYKSKPADIRQVGRDLSVRFVLEGSIQRQDDRVRVTAQLIEAASGTHIWSDRWDRPIADVFGVQTELADHVAAKLAGDKGIVISAHRAAAKRKRPSDLTAYDLYLLGSAAIYRETPEDNKDAIALLKRSLEIDPEFARAWTALSLAHLQTVMWGDSAEGRQLALETAERAIQLDQQDADAHAMLAVQLSMVGDMKQSEIEFERAVELNPNSADILSYYAGFAGAFIKPQYAVELAERAIRLNPNPPLWAAGLYRSAFYHVGRYKDAWHWHEQRPRGRNDRYDYLYSGILLAELGRLDEAHAAVAENLAKFPDTSIEGWMGTPDWADWERELFGKSMRKAGFPVCATENELTAFPELIRLPECVQSKAAN
jgi:TolB-like protein/class 3 adenylate cyclase